MIQRTIVGIAAAASAVLVATIALAQQKQTVSYKTAAQNTKYTQQHIIEVGDVPGHELRVFEIQRTYGADAPTINGMKLKENYTRAVSDYIDGTGSSITYGVYVMENGDKFFMRGNLVAQTVGPGKFTTTVSGVITSGTGKLAGIQGIVRTQGLAEPKAGINENQTDLEYWFDK